MSTEHSAIWSSLRTLELTRQFTSTRVEPAKTYHSSFHDSDKKVHKRNQKLLASALAHISASSPDATAVTACSVEVSYPEGSDAPTVTLRIAQNKRVDRAELENLQTLVDTLVQQISMQQKSVWGSKEARKRVVGSIVGDCLLPLVVGRCRDKLSHILNGPYSKPFRDWHANIVDSNILDQIVLDSSHDINLCSSDHVHTFNDADDIVEAITGAWVITEGYADTLERQWATYDSQSQVRVDTREENVQGEQVDRGRTEVEQEGTEDLDDRESLNSEEMKKSFIYRFLRKLSRYYSACCVVTSELVALVRLGTELNIKVKTVPISTTTSTPAEENEYPSLQSFFEQCVRVDMKSLDHKKVGRLCDSWPHDRKSQNLFLHAEMQMALFYALNPQLCPIQGYIGYPSRSGVNGIARHLQLEDNRYNEDAAGFSLLFSVGGTHNRKYTAWVLPNPSTHIQYHSLDSITFERVCCRFNLVRKDLEKALVREVTDIACQLQKPEYAPDSSGMSGEGLWGDPVEAWAQSRERKSKKRAR